ncbi:MAG: peroxidase [Cryptosporangiaceae bacterium]|nr:peroxidase [Cryptosporangiaceae bacterium]
MHAAYRMRYALLATTAIGIALAVPAGSMTAASAAACTVTTERTLDGSCNNLANPDWGRANTPYIRVAPAHYLDGISAPVSTPTARYISNRIFNDKAQNIFSENHVTQWGYVWGQFLDHTFGLRQSTGGENTPLNFNNADPLEEFTNDLGSIAFTRTPAAPGTGTGTSVRQEINTESSYINAAGVYSTSESRLEWLREGPVDGNLANNGARLMLNQGMLPRRDARGNAATAPVMDADGRLAANPAKAMVAGDPRANENLGLTAVQTLFAREHNRIVNTLPSSLSEAEKFSIARRVVGAEQEYITYTGFLPALGVGLAGYRGYDPSVNPSMSNEFAATGYRAHSMIHGEVEPSAPDGSWSDAQLASFTSQGVEVEHEDGLTKLVIPLNVAFFNPDLLTGIGVGPMLKGIGGESEYRNDEQIDNQLRSTLFQIPVPGNPSCLDGPTLPACFKGVTDLGAIDIARGRDHGMPTYNALRAAYGLAPKTSFTSITGESTAQFPNDPLINQADPINDPNILDFTHLFDAQGNEIPLGSPAAETDAVTGIRRSTLAARLAGVFGTVANVDGFTGMMSERHLPGREFGELQLAIWKKQFEALRDGDRFFYQADRALTDIQNRFGITYRHTLSELIALNTGVQTQANVFITAPAAPAPAAQPWATGVRYAVGDQVTFGGSTYQCRQAHTSQPDWTPPATPALWLLL